MTKGQQQLIRIFFLVGAILFIVSGYVWWTKIYINPERVFWATLANNLATTSVTKQIIDESSPGVQQHLKMQLGGTSLVETTARAEQNGEIQESQTISSPTTDYIRFTEFVTSQTDSSGKKLDLSNIVNVWAESKNETTSSQQFSRVIFDGLLPVANLTASQRATIMKDLRSTEVLDVDFSKVEKNTKNGKTMYTYTVTKEAQGYIEMLKKLGVYVGLADLDAVNSAQYADAPGTVIKVTIDAYARQLAEVTVEGGAFSEVYSSYGIPISQGVPIKNIVSIDELRNRFNKLAEQ